MILPMYTDNERNELKQELRIAIKWLDNNESKKNTQIYKDKEQDCENLYAIIHDL